MSEGNRICCGPFRLGWCRLCETFFGLIGSLERLRIALRSYRVRSLYCFSTLKKTQLMTSIDRICSQLRPNEHLVSHALTDRTEHAVKYCSLMDMRSPNDIDQKPWDLVGHQKKYIADVEDKLFNCPKCLHCSGNNNWYPEGNKKMASCAITSWFFCCMSPAALHWRSVAWKKNASKLIQPLCLESGLGTVPGLCLGDSLRRQRKQFPF